MRMCAEESPERVGWWACLCVCLSEAYEVFFLSSLLRPCEEYWTRRAGFDVPRMDLMGLTPAGIWVNVWS